MLTDEATAFVTEYEVNYLAETANKIVHYQFYPYRLFLPSPLYKVIFRAVGINKRLAVNQHPF